MTALACSCNGGTCLACVLTDLRIEQHEWAMLAYPIEATLAGLAASREAEVARVRASVSLGASSRSISGPPERLAYFDRVFGSATVPVKQLFAVPFMADLPGIGKQAVYELDLDAITPEQRERLIEYGIERFSMSRADCERELETHGFPILADGCVFVSTGLDFL